MRTKKNLKRYFYRLSKIALLAGIVFLGLSSCNKAHDGQEEFSDGLSKGVGTSEHLFALTSPLSLLTDQNFQHGFHVLHPSTGVVQGSILYAGGGSSPKWNLSQWYSNSSLYGATPTPLSSGSYRFADSNKAITIGPASSTDRDIIFAINGQNEFGDTYRTSSQPFPHLIIDQRIADPDGWLGSATPFIGALDSLNFQIDAYLDYHARNQKAGYNSAIHALQFSCVFLVQNLNPSSAGYGKSMYFLIMLFDDRYSLPGLSIGEDIFSGQLIYDVGLASFSTTGLVQGQWKTVKGDLLSQIKQGLNEAWSRGYLLESQSYNDYKVSLFTMGFECTGLNIGTMKTRNLSLIAY
ncbi:hypothetical protein [Sphingobacterium chuzhouense]|uniref:DUF4465 domain-containing protein n=1 Tax=Sphingobacterium chuzhouense TaxID=1742264 RepID=A0ABR7XSB2_9SPHI|nr:hypothetical protein [Sphingobacterium chuzhouense]MBD1422043.1 hypothetical protein [Sphingobacterium chuzhouense]